MNARLQAFHCDGVFEPAIVGVCHNDVPPGFQVPVFRYPTFVFADNKWRILVTVCCNQQSNRHIELIMAVRRQRYCLATCNFDCPVSERLLGIKQQTGETVQEFHMRVRNVMRNCVATASASVNNMITILSVHWFADGLESSSVCQCVLEMDSSSPNILNAVQTTRAVQFAVSSMTPVPLDVCVCLPEHNQVSQARLLMEVTILGSTICQQAMPLLKMFIRTVAV